MNSILLIGEDLNTLQILKKRIEKAYPKFTVFSTKIGNKGIELAKKNIPDVTFLDAEITEAKCIEICKQLKKDELTKDIPLVLLTSEKLEESIIVESVKAGIDDFLSKPINDLKLALTIKTMIRLKKGTKDCFEEKVVSEITDENRLKEIDLNKQLETEKALRESERRYRFIVEHQNDLVVQFDRNQKMTFVNSNYCKCFGLNKNEIIGKSFFSLIHNDDIEVLKDSIRSLKFPPHESYHEERAKTVNGWRWFGWSKKAVIDDNGEILEVVSVGRDVTERREMEQKLKKSELKLQELNATKDKFFSIIAHDLRGPFNSILGFSELIAEKCENNDFKDVGKMSALLNKSAKQSFDLLTNLLEWSRTQRGKKQFEPKNVVLIPLLKKEVELVSLSAKEKEIAFKCDCPDISVFADYNMLQTIIRNLVSNAIKYCNIGGEIHISVQQNNKEVQISVRDNGIGMPEEQQKKLFKLGEIESTPGTIREKGTGLGLILCKEFVEQHYGKIWVESKVGSGSVFSFSLPNQQSI